MKDHPSSNSFGNWTPEEELGHIKEAALSAYWDWRNFTECKDPIGQAHSLISMQNSMHDLATWLPGWDVEIGEIREEE